MRHGFVKVAAATPDIQVADVEFNKENICRGIEEAEKANAKILVFPELCVTGYTCSDLFDHAVLLKDSEKGSVGDRRVYQRQGSAGVCGSSA